MFEKNIQAIREKNPELAEKLEKIDLESIKDIVVANAENEDLIIGYKGVALHSTVDPIREANALWNKTVQSELKKNDAQVVFGLGLGYLFKRAYVNSNSKIYLVEPFTEVLRFVLEHVDLSAELSDKRVYVTDNPKDIINKLKSEYLQGDKTEVMYLPAYAVLAKDSFEDMTIRLIKIIEEKTADINTIVSLSKIWVKNFILNMPHFFNSRPLGFFEDLFVDKTALIIAAGPSLAENLEKIKQNQNKFVTIAVGKACKVLAENDIIPDFVVFADARNTEFQFKNIEKVLEKSNFIITSKSDNKLTELNAKSKILYLPETDPFTKLFDANTDLNPGSYSSASSVSIISYFIAKALGFSNIAFAGLDLAFPDNKIYATGEDLKLDENEYIQMEDIKISRKKVKYTKDKDGNDLPTRDDYLVFIRQFEEILEEEMSLSKVINTSTKGAYVNGMEYLEFDQFIGDLNEQNLNVDELINNIHSNTQEKWTNCVKIVFDELYQLKTEIEEIKNNSGLLINEIANVLNIIEKDDIDNLEAENLNELRDKLTILRKQIMNNLILQNSIQGNLWAYTQKYKTENMGSKENIIINLEADKYLSEAAHRNSVEILEYLEISAPKMKELSTLKN